jgi:tripartite-type tricarboxylate transporter receptor subunit TctC
MRRRLLAMIGLLGLALAPPAGAQEAWPTRPIRMVIAFPPGGPTDLVARVLAERMGRELGQPVVIENRPGANGNIGHEAVARAEPDGQVVLYNTSSIALSAVLYQKLPYDTLRDFAPVALTAVVPLVVVVNPAVPVTDIQAFIAHLKARPNQLSYGSSGNGNVTHMGNFLFLHANGLEAQHVPYRGSAPALTDAAGGQVQFLTDTLNSALPLIRDGRLRALAVTSRTRSGLLPEVPTLAETVMPGFEIGAWQGIMLPARTPPAIVQKLNAAVLVALRDPEVRAKLAAQGAEPLGSTPEDYAAYLRGEIARWGKVAADSGAKLD